MCWIWSRFATEEACQAFLEKLRWPQGFVCPRCGNAGAVHIASRTRLMCRSRLVSDWSGTKLQPARHAAVCASCQRWFQMSPCLGTGMSGTSGGCGWRGTHRQRCRNAGRRSLGASEASPGTPGRPLRWQTSQEIRSRCEGSPVQGLALASGFPSSYSDVTGAK